MFCTKNNKVLKVETQPAFLFFFYIYILFFILFFPFCFLFLCFFPFFPFFFLKTSCKKKKMSYLSAEKAEGELAQSIKKACSIEESAPKQKHVRSKFSVKD
jgi:O-antigen ligase